jgi:hypothetical protein
MGCRVPQSLAAGGNRSYLYLMVVTSEPWYLWYKTMTVAPEPSVERVARAIHSTEDRIGTIVGFSGEVMGLEAPR